MSFGYLFASEEYRRYSDFQWADLDRISFLLSINARILRDRQWAYLERDHVMLLLNLISTGAEDFLSPTKSDIRKIRRSASGRAQYKTTLKNLRP